MGNAVFAVGRSRCRETMLPIKLLQSRLGANPYGLRAPMLREAGYRLPHQQMAGAAAPQFASRDNPAYAGLGIFHAGGKTARIGRQPAFYRAQQMHGL